MTVHSKEKCVPVSWVYDVARLVQQATAQGFPQSRTTGHNGPC